MNSVNLIGRLTKDPDIRYTQEQMCMARFTLAVDRIRSGQEKQTDFISCVSFGKPAETVEKYVSKGNRLGVTGSIKTGSYTNKDGKKVYTTDVVADRVFLLESAKPKEEDAPDGFEALDEELPF